MKSHGETCATCRAWWRPPSANALAPGDVVDGQCRRYAPKEAAPPGYAHWPDTMSIDWCLEHLPKEEPRSD